MGKFIYTIHSEARDRLLKLGYVLLKQDERNNIYVFENKPGVDLSFMDNGYILSDTLTF